MRRLDPDIAAAVLLLLLCCGAGIPVLLAQLEGADATIGPAWLWWAVFGGFLLSMVLSTVWSELEQQARARWSLGAQVVLGSLAVFLVEAKGWSAILLVFSSAIAVYIASPTVAWGIVLVHTVVIATATWLRAVSWVEVVMTAFLYLLIQATSVLAVMAQRRAEAARRELAQAHAEARAANALLAETSRSTERLRIARDLHDVVGHQLTALALELEVASHQSTPPASEHVTRARAIAKDLLADVRSAVDDLRDTPPDLGQILASVVADLPRPRVHLDVADGLVLDERRTSTLVRCVQEVLTNAIRHADARELWITVGAGPSGETVLTARDDGRGAASLVLGNGLRGIRERVEELGGSAGFGPPAEDAERTTSHPRGGSGGFQVSVLVPAP